jgi:protein-disulfide isomerase
MTEHAHLVRVRQDMESGRKSGVRATPGFFIDGKRQDVSFGLRLLFDATEAALQRG